MRSPTIIRLVGTLLLLAVLMAQRADAATDGPWETYGFSGGLFLSDLNTSFRLGGGIGLDVDAEALLDLDSTSRVFRVNGLWRFSKNKRHRLDLSWFAFHRDAIKTVGQDFEFEKPDGTLITVETGTTVNSFFNIDIYQCAYSYSFLQDERIDFAAAIGLYVMPFDIGLSTSGASESSTDQEFIAPLPTLGFRLDITLTPRWYFRSATQLFYLKYDQFQGSLLSTSVAIEYKPWAHVGLGLSVDKFKITVAAEGEDYPLIDFSGNAEFEYTGVQFYARVFF